MAQPYVELHTHSNYSFKEGASSLDELIARALELGYPALAVTDHDNLCGALQFARAARSLNLQPIIGSEVTLSDGAHLTLLAETRKGYANLSRLLSFARFDGERLDPRLDSKRVAEHAEGLVLLTGCRTSTLPKLAAEGRTNQAEAKLRQYLDWFGPSNVFVELQQNRVHGDTVRNRRLVEIAGRVGVPVVATGNVHYHVPDRKRLHDCLVAIQHNMTLEEAVPFLKPNNQFSMKSASEVAALFKDCPEAVANTLRIAERCTFDLSRDLGYRFPDYPVPPGHTPLTYLAQLCREAAVRRYGSITPKVEARLREELRLVEKHNLAGFFLIYYEVVQEAREVMIELGLSDPEIPLEERPPGRGRGSSVAMLIGYLLGLSHIDPLRFNLSLERFIHDDLAAVPDIDLDFPRNIREKLIERVHKKWGWDRAALTGMISTYQFKGVVRDLGKALGLPAEDVDRLAKRSDSSHGGNVAAEMKALPEFRHKADAPVWRDLIEMAAQLDGFPKYLAQHPGGMVISSSPLIDLIPVQPSAMEGRYVMQWDKDSVEDAGMVKIDFLALGALSQMQECLQLIERRTGKYIDLSRINMDDPAVYDMICKADTIGIFQVESAAQMQTTPRIRPRNLVDMAYEVAAVRPGVGANDGVSQFILRRNGAPWDYDHPLEKRALERTLGVILFQDQFNQLAVEVAGFSPGQADQLRRAFTRKRNEALIAQWKLKFMDGAMARGVPEPVAGKIFAKMNGHYMFPESHAYAFGVTAYQMAWLRLYYPLEFYVAIFNQQPMGFYNLETLKEDARRHGIIVLNPDINESMERCTIKDEALLIGLLNVKEVDEARAKAIVEARQSVGRFTGIGDAMRRTGLAPLVMKHLVSAGAFDALCVSRRAGLWEIWLHTRPAGLQQALPLPVEQDMVELPIRTLYEDMEGEYYSLGLFPRGHLMGLLRRYLPKGVLSSDEVHHLPDGTEVTVAGLVIRRQRPLGKAVFLTSEDETGHAPFVVWPDTFERFKQALKEPVLLLRGVVSRREGTMNIVVKAVKPVQVPRRLPLAKEVNGSPGNPPVLPKAKNWG
jgi:error-prone DNA polymerase